MFLPSFKIDANDFFAWAVRLNDVGFSKFYIKDFFSDYTPGFLYILNFLGFIKNFLHIENNFFYLLLKLPAIFAELFLGILLFNEVKKRVSNFCALIASTFVLLNPVLIFNSTIWGQVDSILALLLYLTIHYLTTRRFVISSIFLGLSLLFKPQAITLFPLFLLFIIKEFSLKNLLKLLIPFSACVLLLSFPFFTKDPLFGLAKLIKSTADQYQFTSLFAYNFWGVIGFWIPDSTLFYGITYQKLGFIFLLIYWIIIGFFYYKKKVSIYTLATLATLGFFFLPTRVHERYLYPALVFLVLTASLYKSQAIFILTGGLSILHLMNLYYVYVYYNELYLHLPKLLYNPIIYNFLESNSKLMSSMSTIIFIFITIVIIRTYAAVKKT